MRFIRTAVVALLVCGLYVMPVAHSFAAPVDIKPTATKPAGISTDAPMNTVTPQATPAVSTTDTGTAGNNPGEAEIIAASLQVMPVTMPIGAPQVSAKAHIMLDAATGTIMMEDNADKQLPIASVTKVMSLLLFMEAHDMGNLPWEGKVTVSKNAAGMGGSQVLLDPNVAYMVSDLMKSVTVSSGNDATVALAEHVAGSETAFVEMMNQKAQALGMTNTRFVNCTGLPAQGKRMKTIKVGGKGHQPKSPCRFGT